MEFDTLFDYIRLTPDSQQLRGAMALNISLSSSSSMRRWRRFRSTDPAMIDASYPAAHEHLVDNLPWLNIVRDLDLRAMDKRVAVFVRRNRGFST